MARFYGILQGNRGQASRLGTAASGINGHIRGWGVGGSVEMHARGEHDTCSLLLTGGSNGVRNSGVEIAAFEEPDGRTRFIVRLPGNIEAHGYVGDAEVRMCDRSGDYDHNEPDGTLVYTFGKARAKGAE